MGFIGASALSTITGIVSLASGFMGSIIIARLLGPHGSGEVAFALFVATTGALLAGYGVPNVLLRYMQTYDRPGNPGGGLARLLLANFLVPAVLGLLVLLGYALWLYLTDAQAEHIPSVWVMAGLMLFAYAISGVADAAARGLNRFAESARYAFIGCLLQVPLIALGGYFYGVPGALVGYVARCLPQVVRIREYIARRPDPDVAVTPNMKAVGRNSWISSIIGMVVWTRIELLFLGAYFAASEMGHYAAGLTLAGLVVQLPGQMLGGLTPHIGAHHDNGNIDLMRVTCDRIMRWLGLMILPICFGGAAIMGELLPLLFGAEFAEAVPMARVLVAFAFLTALSTVPSIVINACERSDFFLLIAPVTAVLSIAVFALAVPFGGGLGAAWGRTLVHGVWLAWLLAFCWRRLSIPVNVRDMLLIGFAALLCAGAAYGVLLQIGGIVGITLAVAAGAIVYAVALRVLRVVPRDDVEALITNLPSRIPRTVSSLAYRVMMAVAVTPGRAVG
ncbi:lipopolysaccharide biosynthesis protein [Shinella pollutisoli]|uniref:Lipopolysaccharide biosynthesis protein n=1 Tax=Shinella pollutisoli TaxID=2250594 RepID=A0ABV7DIM6_9HYPH|nr:lipopolysaccharide biosynthesis protein [Shinella pollutisoli]